MGHDVAQRNRLGIRRGNPEIQVIVHIAVKIQLALLDLLHDRGPGKQF